jgi:hypothetical protein
LLAQNAAADVVLPFLRLRLRLYKLRRQNADLRRAEPVTEEQVVAFVRERIRSVWALELLLLLARDRTKTWRTNNLVREMRSSPVAVEEALRNLTSIGLAVRDSDGHCQFQATSPELGELVSALEVTYAAKPVAIVKAIGALPHDKLRIFADAFKLKE